MSLKSKPKLLIYTSTFPRWKGDTDPPFVYELSKRLTDQFDIYVLTPFYPCSKQSEIVDNIHITRFRYFIGKYQKLAGGTGMLPTLKQHKLYWFVLPFFLFFSFFNLVIQIIKIKPDIVHAHWLLPQGFLVALASYFCDVPFVVTLHGADVFALKNFAFKWIRKFTLTHATKVTVVSQAIFHEIKPYVDSPEMIAVIPMGVDAGKFYKRRENGIETNIENLRILYVGRLSEKKGVQYLLEALKEVKKQGVKFHATIVGHGELESHLKKINQDFDLGSRVRFVGGVHNDELPEIYAKHDIFVGPSITAKGGDTEGFGLTFVEAGMAGCLLIGGNVGGVEDIIQDNKTGILVVPKSPDSIVSAIKYIIENPYLSEMIRKKGQMRCYELFDWENVLEKYKNVLSELVHFG